VIIPLAATTRLRRGSFTILGLLAASFLTPVPQVVAGGPFWSRAVPPPQGSGGFVTTGRLVTRPQSTLNSSGRLGTFYPTPYLMVRGNAPAGGGYSPLGSFGDSTLSMYGPLSPFRPITAPVWTYSRGYDGRVIVRPGTSFSTPNAPSMTNVVYPTQSTNYFGFRESGSPPWYSNAINWIDQN
jgi:hypothetical protein